MRDQYKIVTDRIVSMLEAGTRPWCKPWIDGVPVTGALQRPLRVCGTPYTGINVLNLWCAAQARGFNSRHWLTFNAAKEMGASVRKGAKAELAFYVGKHTVTDDKNGEESEREISFLRAYHVFNADEIENLPAQFQPATPVAAPAKPGIPYGCECAATFCNNTGAAIAHGGNRAFYMPSTDSIRMPFPQQFTRASLYYSTLLHELAHWTSAPARCDRTLGKRFGDNAYAAEELVAELASAFLCADLGLDAEPREDHASYIASWISVLKNDNRAIFKAATLAEAAARYLHARQPATVPTEAPEPVAVPGEAPEPVAVPGEAPEPVAVPGEAPEPVAVPGEAPEPVAVPGEAPEPVAVPAKSLIRFKTVYGGSVWINPEHLSRCRHQIPLYTSKGVRFSDRPRYQGATTIARENLILDRSKPDKPAKAGKPASKSYRDSTDFLAALTAARAAACAAHGARWNLADGATAWARVPASWVRMAVFGRTIRGVRDVALPAARFWPDGALPIGPDYAPAAPAPRLSYPAKPTPATLALWARSHGLVQLDGVYVSEQEARVMFAKRAQAAADRARMSAADYKRWSKRAQEAA